MKIKCGGRRQTKVAQSKPRLVGCFKLLAGVWGFILGCTFSTSALAAETLTLRVGPLEPSLSVSDLEQFAQTGELPSSLKPYRLVLTSRVRQLLNQSLYLDPSMADTFFEEILLTSEGAQLLKQLETALPGTTAQQLVMALKQAVQTNQLNVLSFLRAHPEANLTVDLTAVASITLQLNAFYLQNQVLSPLLERNLNDRTGTIVYTDFDPTAPGTDYVRRRTLVLRDRERQRTIPVDLYYPTDVRGPLVVLSHGFAADRKFLAYLGHHLASHGFTVASIEHPGSNIDSLVASTLGSDPGELLPASEFIDRPKDISFLLDELERINQRRLFNKFATDQVSVIGHSFGGYTALALGGAQLNPKELRAFCQGLSPLRRSPADWLQCSATELPYGNVKLRDRRVKSAIALNPIVGHLFGQQSLNEVKIPTLIFSSSEDAITPTISHQLQPFEELKDEKYLLVAVGATHMSVTDLGNANSPVATSTLVRELMGPEAEPIRKLMRGVSLAFLSQQTSEAKLHQAFLTPAYVQSLSTPNLSVHLTKALPASINTWLNVLHFSNQRLALRKPQKGTLFSRLEKQFFNLRKILPQPEYCTGQLDQIFDSLLDSYNQPSDRLS